MISRKDVQQLSKLARLRADEREVEDLTADLEEILKYVSQLEQARSGEGEGAESALHRNVFREDGEPHESGVYTEVLMRLAPKAEGGYFYVDKVIKSE